MTGLARVVEAGKAAQANVIRCREEMAVTGSPLNTAKVMENNPVALAGAAATINLDHKEKEPRFQRLELTQLLDVIGCGDRI